MRLASLRGNILVFAIIHISSRVRSVSVCACVCVCVSPSGLSLCRQALSPRRLGFCPVCGLHQTRSCRALSISTAVRYDQGCVFLSAHLSTPLSPTPSLHSAFALIFRSDGGRRRAATRKPKRRVLLVRAKPFRGSSEDPALLRRAHVTGGPHDLEQAHAGAVALHGLLRRGNGGGAHGLDPGGAGCHQENA